MLFYNIMTIDAAAMLKNAVKRQRDDNHNYKPEFRFDFNNKIIRTNILRSTDHQADNALFFQLIASQYGDENVNMYRRQEDCILESLIYVDFKDVFSEQKKRNEKEQEDIDADCMVLFEDGFSIVYENDEVKTYIPFDKSGSMSRNFTITFVDKDLFPEVDRRLRLEIDFSSINVVPSKYYAYRGLYLTNGVRADEDSDHILNQNTVLVIEDDTHDYMRDGKRKDVPIITVNLDMLKKGRFKCEKKEESIRLNSFDGEGLVSPYFAEYLNQSRKQEVYMKRPAVSFQIRMPYIKGMLHQVDFHRFFREQLSKDDYYIKDIFGIPRRIADVQIVLTKSMFKCAGWLNDYMKIHPEIEDPMEWFFDMFHRYKHALYVCNTDSNMGAQKVPLNYQFLNTMDLDPESLENLINRHLNEAHSITETGNEYAVDLTEGAVEALFEEEAFSASIPAWRHALDLNHELIRDDYIKKKLKYEEFSLVKDIGRGRIRVDGALKYLSGDLLALLIHMIYNKKAKKDDGIGSENGLGVMVNDGLHINAEFNKAAVKKLQKQLIHTGNFYTADHERLKLDKCYSILRSPHLSRNEQCSLRSYIPRKDDGKNIYNIYFSHLKNVIMIPYESIDAVALGGADYDGDMVKVILDDTVNEAILKGAYSETYSKNRKLYYERKLPIVKIPSLKADREPVRGIISYRLVKDTFSNQVGRISNLAIQLGKLEYSPSGKSSLSINKCAECTLATGLEIDAVKTGVRPNIDDLIEGVDVTTADKEYFLSREKTIKYMTPKEMEVLKASDCRDKKGESLLKGFIKVEKKDKKILEAKDIPSDDKSAAIIDRLPGYFLKEFTKDKRETWIRGSKTETGEIIYFKFQVDETTGELKSNWKKELEQEPGWKDKLKNTKAIVKSYKKIMSDYSYLRKRKEKASQSSSMSNIGFLMKKLFDCDTEKLPVTHTEIMDAISIAHHNLKDCFETIEEVENAIEKMKELDWSFISDEEREAALYQILGTESLLKETKEILLCNEPDAFNFLIFYLYDIRSELIQESTVDENTFKNRKSPKSFEGYDTDVYEELLHEYIAGENNKEPKRCWSARIIDLCRDELAAEKMFNKDFDRALKYYLASSRSVDTNKKFLWEVFKTREILRNLYIKPKE